jgi:hypothetical protein
VAALASGCTFLVSFDTVEDAGCTGAHCGHVAKDATIPPTRHPDTGMAEDAEGAVDSPVPVDVGDCAMLGEGAACAKPSTCQMPATCQGGVCTPNPLPDGTGCGDAPDACHVAPMCTAGVCAPPAPLAEGTECAKAPDACHKPGTCASGVCGAPPSLADGTPCGTAPDACHEAPTCASGTCGASKALAEGANWNAKDTHARCCGGKPVETTTDADCGVCGWSCGSGQSCGVVGGEYLCTGCTADSECSSNCCSLSPAPNHCSPGNCAGGCQSPDICTGGSHCVVGATVDYCTY